MTLTSKLFDKDFKEAIIKNDSLTNNNKNFFFLIETFDKEYET